ncbi:MAG: acyl-CoA thioesterase [Oscillospiraceae bacterium]|nr:acyl-CoA thioesterase [Oscillospiraceae bacterium]
MTAYKRKVHYYETDQMGVVHHANYIRWLEEARVDYLERVGFGYEKAVAACIDFAVLSVSCEYKSMVRFGDTVNIHMDIAELGVLRMTLTYRISDAETGALRALGESRHCYYHSGKKRPVSLKKEMPELYEIFESAVESAGAP